MRAGLVSITFRKLSVAEIVDAAVKAGLEGIEKEYPLPVPTEENAFEMPEAERLERGIGLLPGSLVEAIQEAEGSDLVRRCLGDHVFESLITNKKIEWDTYRTHVTDFERERYLPIL